MTQSQRRAAKAAYDAVAAIAYARIALGQAGIDVYTEAGYEKFRRATDDAQNELNEITKQLVGDPEAEEFDVDESNVNLDQPDYGYQRQ